MKGNEADQGLLRFRCASATSFTQPDPGRLPSTSRPYSRNMHMNAETFLTQFTVFHIRDNWMIFSS